MSQALSLEISSRNLWRALLIVLGLIVVYLIRDVLALVFISLLLAAVLEPAVDYLVKKSWPKSLAILLWYFVIIGLLTLIFALIVPPFTKDIAQMANDFPYEYTQARYGLSGYSSAVASSSLWQQFTGFLKQWRDAAGTTDTNLFRVVFGIFGGFLSFISVLVMTFYMLLEKRGLQGLVEVFVPAEWQEKVGSTLALMQQRMGLWLRGQLVLMLVVGVLSYVSLLILGVRYALVLALLAGVLEIVPFIGPITSGIPAVVLAYAQSPLKAIMVLVIYIIIQQSENHILVPKILGKSIGVSPLIVIIAVLVGAKLGGIMGALVAVPVVTALSVCWERLADNNTAVV